MLLGSVFFSAWNWLWPLVAILIIAAVVVFWANRSAASPLVRWLCPVLKVLGCAALATCLLEPLWSGQRARPGANLFAIVADNSQGLQIKDRGSSQTRGQVLRDLLNPQRGNWQTMLDDNFEVRRYFFDARLQGTKDFSELEFDGRASAIGSALRTLVERFRGRPLAGILLLTDGNATDLHGAADLTGLPPVYPVVIGSADPIKDVSIEQAHTTQTDFEDAPVSVQADVSVAGYSGSAILTRILDSSGQVVAEQTLTPRKENDLLAFRFQFKPPKPGLSFYRLSARVKDELSSVKGAGGSTEATLANNSTTLVVDRGRGPYRILYVSGRPNWEFKFLNRALQEDSQLQLVGLIRVAKREPKFTFLGRVGETSNPLFRGFNNQSPEEIERYDQPVIVRLNTRDQFELRSGFPRTPEELYEYHAVIVDDLEAEFFTPDQAALVQRFVSERGGGFMMLGGMETFQQGKYQHTPIGDMLPVYLDPVDESKLPGQLRYALTREGFLQPWARLRDNEAAERARIESMAPFQVLNRVHQVKPGASIIATVSDTDGTSYPALVIQRFGRGRTGALTIGDFWHWGLHDADAHRDMDKAWRQLMRWLVTDVPNRVELAIQPGPGDDSGVVSLEVRVRDPKFQPLEGASMSLEVKPVLSDSAGSETNVVRLQPEPSPNEPGVYRAIYVPRLTAAYQATVCVTNSEGVEVGRAAAGWSTDLAAEEFHSLSPNVELLKSIANKTGGEIVLSDKLDQFARNLPRRQAPVMEAWNYPLWHTPAMFGFALLCLVCEWGLRRWKGMP